MRLEDKNPDATEQDNQPPQASSESAKTDEESEPKNRIQKILDTKTGQIAAALAGIAIGAGVVQLADKTIFHPAVKSEQIVDLKSAPAKPLTTAKPQVKAKKEPEKQQEKREHTSFVGTIDDQVKILSSAEKTAYYLDDNFRIIGSFPYDFKKPAQNKKEKDSDYKARVSTLLTAWHTENRKKLAAKGITVDLENNKPRVQTSPESGFADRIKEKAAPKINRVYPNYRDAFAKTETSKYFTDADVRKEFMDTCIYGQATVESGWNEDAESSAECYGLWQMQANKKKKGGFSGSSVDLIEKNRKTLEGNFDFKLDGEKYQAYLLTLLDSPEASSVMAPFNYDAYLARIKGPLEEVKKRFPFESDASFQKKFVMPMLYCSYIVGGGGVSRLLKQFLDKEGENYAKDFDEENFAWEVIQWFYAYDNSAEGKGAFGKDSVQYALKIFAHAKIIKPVLQEEVKENKEAQRPLLYTDKFKHKGTYAGEYSALLKEAKDTDVTVLTGAITDLVKAGKLIAVDDKTEPFVFAKDLLTTPHVAEYALYPLRAIAEEFATQSGGYQLVVSDLYRQHEDQQKLTKVKIIKKGKKKIRIVTNPAATTGVSTHEFGNTFDITKMRVVNPQGKIEYSQKFTKLLRKILMAHQRKGAVMIVEEKAAFHMMALKPVFGQIPRANKSKASEAKK